MVFLSQFCTVLLLGLQTINVAAGNIIAAMIVSFLLGISGYFTYSQIAKVQKPFTKVWYQFIFAGPLGIALSIKLSEFLRTL